MHGLRIEARQPAATRPASPGATYSGGVLKILLVVALVAVAVYLVVRASQGGAAALGKRGPKRPPKPPRPRAVAPDDDEDFLRDLDRRKLHGDDEDPAS